MFKRSRLLIITVLLLVSFFASSSIAFAAFGDTTLKLGSRGEDVKVLQQKLNSLKYWCNADGIFGTWTEKMVIQFQTAQGIKATGIVDSVTASRLIKLTSTTTPTTTTPTTTTPTTTSAAKINAIITTAKQQMGIPYAWGGSTPSSGFDCSGFTNYVMAQNGISIPRTAATQFATGTPVDKANLKTGDFVFFTTYAAGASHVGIYLGDGTFIHASSAAGKVTISSLSTTYYTSHYIGARRYVN